MALAVVQEDLQHLDIEHRVLDALPKGASTHATNPLNVKVLVPNAVS
jgi:hypothetical protein